jgi:peptidyl-prolyl cis-trans isomerase SurA
MKTNLLSLFTGAAILAAPVSLCSAQTVAARTSTDTPSVKGLMVDGIAAIVGTKAILMSEVDAQALTMRSAGREPKSELEFAQMKKEALDQLIDAELLVQKAAVEKVEVNDADLLKQFEEREGKVRTQFKSDAEFRAALKDAGFGSIEEWRKSQMDLMRRDMLQRDVVQKLRQGGKMTAINVTDREVTEAFEKAKEKLPRKPARVGIRQIIIPTVASDESKKRARAKIDSIRAELVAHPDDFENIAKKVSMDSASAVLGGDLGWNRRGRMVAEFDRVMFALNPGALSPVIETTFGYHIIRVDRVQPAEVKARHILIRPTLDSTDEARARQIAVEVAAAWRKGANVDSLTIRHHDESSGEDKSIPEFPRDSLPEPYRNAIEGKKVNDVLDPFPIPSGEPGISKFVVAQITFLDEAGEYTLAEYRDRIRQQLSEEGSFRRLIDSLKKSSYVSVRYDPLASVVRP